MKSKKLQKLLAACLCLALVFSMGSLTVFAEGEDVWQAGENTYATFAEALAANEGSEASVTLLKSTKESIQIPEGKTVQLNLSDGVTLTNADGAHTITNNGTLTISGNGTVDNVSHGRAALVNNGTATLKGGTFTRSKEAGTSPSNNGGNSYYVIQNVGQKMTIGSGVTVKANGGYSSLVANGYQNGSGKTNNPSLLITGGTFSGGINVVKNDDRGTLTIEGGTFSNTYGPAVMNWNVATIKNGTFTVNNTASCVFTNGYLDNGYDQGQLTITGGTFNAANNGAGALYGYGSGTQKGGYTKISGGTFHGQFPASTSAYANAPVVSGGTFSANSGVEDYVDSSMTAVPDANGNLIVGAEEEVAVAKIGTKTYASLEAAVKDAKNGDIVELMQNAAGSGIQIPSGTNITIDFKGHTYTIQAPTVGSSGTETNGFQLLKDSTIVMKNGTITSSVARILIQNYCDLTLEDMTLDGSKLAGSNDYVLSNNHGTTRLTGNTSITAKEGDVAFDVCYWSPAYADGVTVIVDTTGTITGKIEYSTYGSSTPENTAANSALIIKNVNHVGTISAVAEGVNIAISGGTFSEAVKEEYCAEDFHPIDNGEGGFSVHQHEWAAPAEENRIEATCTQDGSYDLVVRCSKCGEADPTKTQHITIPAGHTFGTEWIVDGENHWHACVCGEKADTAAHTFGNWVVTREATAEQTGMREKTCSVCGYKVTESIPATGNTDAPKTGENSALVLWIGLFVLAGAGLAGTILHVKKRKAN